MKRKVIFIGILAFVLFAFMAPAQVSANWPRQQASARVPTGQMLIEMIRRPDVFQVLIPGGNYTRGLPTNQGGDSYEVPHPVTVRSFYMSIYPVTQTEFMDVLQGRGMFESKFHGSRFALSGNHHPVENVRWIFAIHYCNELSRRHGLTPAYTITGNRGQEVVRWNQSANGYRLPTEAEWEYAARAGTTTRYSTGNTITESQAAFDAIGGGAWARQTHSTTMPVGSYRSNPWGLYDMHGNVYEWCWDWYGMYPGGHVTNPTGPSEGERTRTLNGDSTMRWNVRGDRQDMRVLRGGSWASSMHFMLSGSRHAAMPFFAFHSEVADAFNGQVGFRIVRNGPR